MKIAIVSGRQQDGTILPRKEQLVWRELCRVLEEELEHPIFKGATLLIPIYSKFDLQVLYLADRKGIDVEYYVPSEDWGLHALPKHQTELVGRVVAPRHINPSSTGRMVDMIQAADLLYVLTDTNGVERFLEMGADKPMVRFATEKMRYQTEAEALAWHEQIAANTKIYTDAMALKEIQEKQGQEDAFLENQEQLDLDGMLSEQQAPSDQQLDDFFRRLMGRQEGEGY